MTCQICKEEKPDVKERENTYANELTGKKDMTYVVCDRCDYENRLEK